jgi:hypothetical protein
MRTPLAIIALAAAVTGCRVHYEDPVRVDASVVTLAVAPDPLRLLVTCPPGNTNCFGSLDATVTVAEGAGLGGRIEFVDVILYNVTMARNDSFIRLGADWLRQQVGTDRVEAGGRLAMRPVIEGYPFPAGQPRPQLEIRLGVRFLDDRGNEHNVTKWVPLV